MTDREKLIEILSTSCAVGKDCKKSCIECTADHLLANGVTIAPEKPRPRPKGWQPMGARSFIEYCPTCKNDGSDLCGLCVMEKKSGYDPKEET